MKKFYDKISLGSKAVNFSIIFSKSKRNFSSEEETKKFIKKLSENNKKYNLPRRMGLKLEESKNMKVYSYNGTLGKNKGRILLYLHGGSFIEEANIFQIKFAMRIAKKTNSTLIFPVYPLAPNSNYKNMYKLIDELYSKIRMNCNDINFLGDSAGGGFILSYAMYLKEKGIKQPNNIVMLSPWVDISMTNPELLVYEKIDNMCGVKGNSYAGKLWADDLDTKNYLVSPMYGDFNDLGFITIITGERDILKPDCLLLDEKLDELKIEHNYIEYKGQGHDFGAYPTKEGEMVIDDIVAIINVR